jgi:hypothetical protein
MHAPPKPEYPVLEPNDLAHYDAFIIGIPTRYGNFPAQWKVRILPPFVFIVLEPLFVGLLGWHRPALAKGPVARQSRWRVRFYRWPWWWPGVNRHCDPLDPRSSRHQLYPPWVCDCLRTVDKRF